MPLTASKRCAAPSTAPRTPPPRRPLSVLRVGGVPGALQLPGAASRRERLFEWTEHPGGSGAMAQKLREGELDVAILLTEAATLFAHKGDVTIVGSLCGHSINVGGPCFSWFESVSGFEVCGQ